MRLLDYEDLRGLGIRYSKCQLWRRERDNSFPQSVKLSSARTMGSSETAIRS